jgi:hypothetical protein
MLIPIIPRNLQLFYQIGLAIFGTDSTTNACARLPICGHDIEDSFSWSLPPRPVVEHAECNSSLGSIPEQVAPHTLYPHTDAVAAHLFPKAVRLTHCLRLAPARPHHAAAPRLRLTTAGFHSRRQGDFAWSRFFPLSVGFAPTASIAKGALTIAPSMLCHDQAIPSISSYSANPLRQRRTNTPWRFHSKKYWWMELALPNSPLGNAFHWHPVRNTKIIPSNTLRGSMGLRPPPGRRKYFRFFARLRLGISDSTRFHNSSDTVHDLMALMAHDYHERFINVNIYLRISSKTIFSREVKWKLLLDLA